MNWKFTHIEHPARIALGVTVLEYCVLDIIYQSQTHPSFTKGGWTNVGCHKIAKFLDLSPATVFGMFDRLLDFGFIEFKEDSKVLKRTTSKWYDVAYIKEEEKLNQLSVRKVNRKATVRKLNTNRSETEHHDVRKMNEKCSETEPIYKVSNLISNFNQRDTSPKFTESEIEHFESQLNAQAEKEEIKAVDVTTPKKRQKPKSPKILFSETEFCTEPDGFARFEAAMIARNEKYKNYDLDYYYQAVQIWSEKGNAAVNWIATAAGFILRDEGDRKAKMSKSINYATTNQNGNIATQNVHNQANDLTQRVFEKILGR